MLLSIHLVVFLVILFASLLVELVTLLVFFVFGKPFILLLGCVSAQIDIAGHLVFLWEK
jgi:hypothetical protein